MQKLTARRWLAVAALLIAVGISACATNNAAPSNVPGTPFYRAMTR